MKLIIRFSIFIILLGGFINTVFAASFSDVPESNEYFTAIEFLKSRGIIDGYEDGTFKPDADVNRAEALKMILNSAGVSSEDFQVSTMSFSDVPLDSWYGVFVYKAKDMGIVSGNPDGTFAPARLVNKAEFAKMLLESFDVDISKHMNLTEGVSIDTSVNDWFLPYISYAKTVGIIYPNLNNELNPQKNLTRGECAEMIYRLVILAEGGDAQKMLSITESHLVSVLVALNNNDIGSALSSANSAVFYSEQALLVKPDEGIVKGANHIALGFYELCLAYKAGMDDDNDSLQAHVQQAKVYADLANGDDSSMVELANSIKEKGDVLLEQV